MMESEWYTNRDTFKFYYSRHEFLYSVSITSIIFSSLGSTNSTYNFNY